jgi:hypothetical protein
MPRDSALPGSIPSATRSGAFVKRLARRRASRATKRAATASEWRLINEALADSAFSRSADSGSPSVPCSPSSPSTRHTELLSRYVLRLRALGRERLRKTHPFCLRSCLRRRHHRMNLRKAQAASSPPPPSKALPGVTARLAVAEQNVAEDPFPDLRVRHHCVSVVRLRGGMQATVPDTAAAAAVMSSAMSELDGAAATPRSSDGACTPPCVYENEDGYEDEGEGAGEGEGEAVMQVDQGAAAFVAHLGQGSSASQGISVSHRVGAGQKRNDERAASQKGHTTKAKRRRGRAAATIASQSFAEGARAGMKAQDMKRQQESACVPSPERLKALRSDELGRELLRDEVAAKINECSEAAALVEHEGDGPQGHSCAAAVEQRQTILRAHRSPPTEASVDPHRSCTRCGGALELCLELCLKCGRNQCRACRRELQTVWAVRDGKRRAVATVEWRPNLCANHTSEAKALEVKVAQQAERRSEQGPLPFQSEIAINGVRYVVVGRMPKEASPGTKAVPGTWHQGGSLEDDCGLLVGEIRGDTLQIVGGLAPACWPGMPREAGAAWRIAPIAQMYSKALVDPSFHAATTLCAGSSGVFSVERLQLRRDARVDSIFIPGSSSTSYMAKQVYTKCERGRVRTMVHEAASNVPDKSAFHLETKAYFELASKYGCSEEAEWFEATLRMSLCRFAHDLGSLLDAATTVVSVRDDEQLRLQSIFPRVALRSLAAAKCPQTRSPRMELSLSAAPGMDAHRDCSVMAKKTSGGEHLSPSACLPLPVVQGESVDGAFILMSDLDLAIPMGIASTGRVRPAIFAASQCLHETSASSDGYIVAVSTGWERHSFNASQWGF